MTSDDWELQPYAGPGPYHVEELKGGHAFIIANKRGLNVAHTPGGGVLFPTREQAEEVLARWQ